MIVGLMQPYFFPYLGYFDLINEVDLWVAFDTVQYIRRGWMNRNRVLHPQAGWQYINVPIVHCPQTTAIHQVAIVADDSWRMRVVGQLAHYRRRAPHYAATIELVRECLAYRDSQLSQFNVHALACVCRHVGLKFDYVLLSDLPYNLAPIDEPGDWALRLCESLGADEYVNPVGGHDLYSHERFAAQGIKLRLMEALHFEYAVDTYRFEPCLSILDVLMWNDVADLRTRFATVRDRLIPNSV